MGLRATRGNSLNRQNSIAGVVLIFVGVVVAAGYAKGWDPLGLLNAVGSRQTKGADEDLVAMGMADETKGLFEMLSGKIRS